MENLIDKIHKLNSVLNESTSTLIPINILIDKLCSIIGSNIYIFDNDYNIFAYSISEKFACPHIKGSLERRELPQYYLNFYKNSNESIVNMYQKMPKCTYENTKQCLFKNRYSSIYPIFSNFKKIAGTLFTKCETPFSQSDKILCEYAIAIISIEMLRREQEKIKQVSIEIENARNIVTSLTSSERDIIRYIMKEIEKNEGNFFLNFVASKTYTAPSTVSSALKKLELATLITTKTMGVKGKYIKVLNDNLADVIDEIEA